MIDGEANSTLDVYSVPDHVFDLMFPGGSDVAFVEDIEGALGVRMGHSLWDIVYQSKVDKKQVVGIHGTLHLTGSPVSKKYFPTGKESEVKGKP